MRYALPGESKYNVAKEFNIDHATYYCTGDDAAEAGYTHSVK